MMLEFGRTSVVGSSHFHSNILFLLTQGDVCFCGPMVCVVPSRFRRLSCGYPGRVLREVQAGGRCEVRRMVYRLFDVKW